MRHTATLILRIVPIDRIVAQVIHALDLEWRTRMSRIMTIGLLAVTIVIALSGFCAQPVQAQRFAQCNEECAEQGERAAPGRPSHESQFSNCTGVCARLEQQCDFSGTRTPACQARFRVCADSCARTGRPTH